MRTYPSSDETTVNKLGYVRNCLDTYIDPSLLCWSDHRCSFMSLEPNLSENIFTEISYTYM